MFIDSPSNASFPTASDTASIPAKRKRDETDETDKTDETDETELDTRPFTIRDPADPFVKPKSYTPICLLSRAQLPLAYLDTAHPGSRLFSAHIQPLEASHEHGGDATVLLAQEDKESRLYAVERVQSRTYALCRLQVWVTEEEILQNVKSVSTSHNMTKRRAVAPVGRSAPWWTCAAVEMPQVSGRRAGRPVLPVSAMQRVMDAPPKHGPTVSVAPTEALSPIQPPEDMDANLPQSSKTALSPDELFQDLAKHYMETLYLERTTLAYFTKGPLSRARAAFSSQTPTAKFTHLADFLRSSTLTSSVLDKKYKERIAELVKALPAQHSESAADLTKRKRKRKWKAKRSKAGLFADEQDYVERWWRADDTAANTENTDAGLRARLTRLRIRETFLQVVLVLEVLSLEASSALSTEACQPAFPDEVQDDESQQTELQLAAEKAPTKPKKKQDLPALLENLLDKLCIWHSLEGISPTAPQTGNGSAAAGSNDFLKNFCIEVVLPFFIPRIPQHATLVNKKLGGPGAQTPPKRSSSTSQKPGDPAARPEKKPRQPLARVLTDTLNRSVRHPPSLNRSATDTDAFSRIKREPSETPPLASVPLHSVAEPANPQRRPRVNPLERMNSKPRLIDLSAMSQASETKLRRKAESDRAIKEAVEGIKKPNRALAVKEVADSADQSFAKAMAKGSVPRQRGRKAESEKVGRPLLMSHEEGLQSAKVAATPSSLRKRQKPDTAVILKMPPSSRPPSSASVVPSSSARVRASRPASSTDLQVPSAFAVPQTGHRQRRLDAPRSIGVEETPSRGFAKFMPKGLATQPGTGTLDSPIARRTAMVVQSTPSKPNPVLKLPETANETPRQQKAVLAATPVRPTDHQRLDLASPFKGTGDIKPRNEGGEAAVGEVSLYASLGWDDEGYEELT
ncbi:uncharacterized protein LTR77_007017 [Saxophila tyrrhenica]|uniref:DNA replication regulator Sld3 C-terminal domain-containing protein n=1 Tax=Saxophila tyrrhenica TaxID=1690608 RepID=A0AAV9P8I2_9PEZI|nr:hypothetical protein LTR77_007017 [Saxophila tyrrhenica]